MDGAIVILGHFLVKFSIGRVESDSIMFRFLSWLLGVLVLSAVIYAAVRVPIGKMTLWQHLQAIWGSSETQRLREDVADQVHQWRGLSADAPGRTQGPSSLSEAAHRETALPSDRLTEGDRHGLKGLLDRRVPKSPNAP